MKKILGTLIVTLFTLGLTDCGGSRGMPVDRNGNLGSQDNLKPGFKDSVVPKATCDSTTTYTVAGNWKLRQTLGTLTRDVTLYVQDAFTTLTYVCTNSSASRSATVTVPSKKDSSALFFMSSETNEGGDRQLPCSATLTAGRAPYQITGACLKITIGSETHTYTRSN